MSDDGTFLTRLRNNPNFAGGLLAVLSFIATYLVMRPVRDIDSNTRLVISLAMALLAFYKGRRAVQKRLGDE